MQECRKCHESAWVEGSIVDAEMQSQAGRPKGIVVGTITRLTR
jgi:hypothetical protein